MNIKITGNGTLAQATEHWMGSHNTNVKTDLVWVCHDTPVAADGSPDNFAVLQLIQKDIIANPHCPILISSQIKVGTMQLLAARFPCRWLAYQPENIRVATAIEDFGFQNRVVIGRPDGSYDHLLKEVFTPISGEIIFTTPVTAEMCKHALNAWLAMNIAFINEIARVCHAVGAGSTVVSKALLTERRVGPLAPLHPGKPFGGGHLARDIHNLCAVSEQYYVPTPIIASILPSNDMHGQS